MFNSSGVAIIHLLGRPKRYSGTTVLDMTSKAYSPRRRACKAAALVLFVGCSCLMR